MIGLLALAAHAFEPFAIELVDATTGLPAPCVTLVTTNDVPWTSDVNGRIAFVEPGLAGQSVWFTVDGPGYTLAPDFFGYRGFAVDVVEGGTVRIGLDPSGPPGACSRDHHTRLAEDFPDPGEMHRIEVLDAATGRGVPLVTLGSAYGPLLTDSAGNVAVYDPDLLGTVATMSVTSHGYAHATGEVTVDLIPGGHTVIEIDREQIAERLYRVTGQGIHRDTTLLDLPAPLARPNLNAQVMGQDSALAIPWDGRILWIFGDTNKVSYPLGLFQSAGAWSDLPDSGGLPPGDGIDLSYLVGDDGFARAMAPNEANEPTWINGLAVVDDDGTDVLVALYGLFEGLTQVEAGVLRFDDSTDTFVREAPLPLSAPFLLANHFVEQHVAGERWWYAREGYRVRATIEAFTDATAWEAWSPTDAAWVPGAGAPTEGWSEPREPDTGEVVGIHNGGVAFNAYRRRFLHVFTQNPGSSWLGEIWVSEADTPFGPWMYARKVVTHDTYSFYNPLFHPFFDEDGGRVVHFQGTYTEFFSGAPVQTPYYEYNQIMYRLGLDDPRLRMPVAVYDVAGDGSDLRTAPALSADDPPPVVAFHAPDQPDDGSLAAWWEGPSCGARALEVGAAPPGEALFWMLPPDADAPGTVALYRGTDGAGRTTLTTDPEPDGIAVEPDPVGLVWPHLIEASPPVLEHLPPRVDAGPDHCLSEETDGAGVALVLEADSRGISGGSWSWAVDGRTVATGSPVTLQLAAGPHRVLLTWTDGEHTLVDEVQVAVEAGPPGPGPTEPEGESAATPSPAEGDRCGCRTTGSTAWWLPLLGLAIRRIRRA